MPGLYSNVRPDPSVFMVYSEVMASLSVRVKTILTPSFVKPGVASAKLRRREPGVRHHEDERCHRQNQIARWLRRKAIQGHDHARAHGPLLHEMGWRVAYHGRSLPRSGPRLRCRPRLDLRAGRGLVPIVYYAARYHGPDSAHAGRHSASTCADGNRGHDNE